MAVPVIVTISPGLWLPLASYRLRNGPDEGFLNFV
jgi:hypothetical protein